MKDLTPEEEITPLEALLTLEAVLLFHSCSPWDEAKRRRWKEICDIVLGPCSDQSAYGRPVADWEATTRILCNLARKALGREREHENQGNRS